MSNDWFCPYCFGSYQPGPSQCKCERRDWAPPEDLEGSYQILKLQGNKALVQRTFPDGTEVVGWEEVEPYQEGIGQWANH